MSARIITCLLVANLLATLASGQATPQTRPPPLPQVTTGAIVPPAGQVIAPVNPDASWAIMTRVNQLTARLAKAEAKLKARPVPPPPQTISDHAAFLINTSLDAAETRMASFETTIDAAIAP
jgi:hypothetical protein